MDILRRSGSPVEKECSHEKLMDLIKVNDLVTSIFLSVTMSHMCEYWKDFLLMCDALLLQTWPKYMRQTLVLV